MWSGGGPEVVVVASGEVEEVGCRVGGSQDRRWHYQAPVDMTLASGVKAIAGPSWVKWR